MEHYFFYAIAGIEVLLPLACILWLLAGRSKDIFAWIFRFATSALWFNAAFLGLPWAYTSTYLRWVLLLVFLIATVVSFLQIKEKRLYVRKGFSYYLGMVYILISLTLALLLNISITGGFFTDSKGYEIASPFKSGTDYIVVQGGESGVTNLFHHYFKQRKYMYALDVVQVNRWGNRASNLAPEALTAYEIYGDTLYCPCTGTVAEARAGVMDNAVGEVNSRQILGNYVKMDCGDFYLTIAHLKPESMRLKPGQQLEKGAYLGLVGNTGYSIEPHLHMEGYILNEDSIEISVPLLINGRFLSMNQKIKP